MGAAGLAGPGEFLAGELVGFDRLLLFLRVVVGFGDLVEGFGGDSLVALGLVVKDQRFLPLLQLAVAPRHAEVRVGIVVGLAVGVDGFLELAATFVALGNGQRSVNVDMTLTAPGCGMGDILVADAREKIAIIPTVADVSVELVFDPLWNVGMMSDEARLQTGLM